MEIPEFLNGVSYFIWMFKRFQHAKDFGINQANKVGRMQQHSHSGCKIILRGNFNPQPYTQWKLFTVCNCYTECLKTLQKESDRDSSWKHKSYRRLVVAHLDCKNQLNIQPGLWKLTLNGSTSQ